MLRAPSTSPTPPASASATTAAPPGRSRSRHPPEIYRGHSRGFAPRRTPGGRQRRRAVPQRGRGQLLGLAPARPDSRSCTSSNRRTIPCFWLAVTQGGGLFVSPDCGLSFENPGHIGRRPQHLRHRLRSRLAGPHRGGRLGNRRGGLRGSRQDLAVAQRRAAPSRRLERGLRSGQARPPLRQRARGGALRLAGLRPHLAQGRTGGQRGLSHDVRSGGARDDTACLAACCCCALPLAARRPAVRASACATSSSLTRIPEGRAMLGYADIAAKLQLHEDGACAPPPEGTAGAGPTGDMFWMFPVTAVAYLDRGQLTAAPAARCATRSRPTCRTAAIPRITGCCTTRRLYLMAQLWPDEPATNGTPASRPRRICAKPRVDRILGEADHHARPGRVRSARTTWACSCSRCLVPGGVGEGSGDEEARAR